MDKLIFKKTLCILVAGKAGTGKSTSAEIINEYLLGMGLNSIRFSFAYGVKQVARSMGWDGQKDDKGRKLLQDIGRVGREYDEDTWAKQAFKLIENSGKYPYDVVICDDWRFPNELAYAKKQLLYKLSTIRLVAPNREILLGKPEYDDISETALPNPNRNNTDLYTYLVDNTGEKLELEKSLERKVQRMIRDPEVTWNFSKLKPDLQQENS